MTCMSLDLLDLDAAQSLPGRDPNSATGPTATVELRNGTVLLPDGRLERRSLFIADGRVAAGEVSPARVLDASGFLVLPGIVDLHGDAFERQLMPRPGVQFDHRLALLETDRQMLANGITTAFHGLTLSWEPGLRGDAAADRFLEALAAARPLLGCDTRLHLRFETFHLDAVEKVVEWIAEGRIDLLAFNDHTEMIAERVESGRSLSTYTSRTGLTEAELRALVQRVRGHRSGVANGVARLAAAAKECGLPMASHDDPSIEVRQQYRDLGCTLCEFPLSADTAFAARKAGDPVILGAPNVVRGGSHNGHLSATDAIERGACTVLTSDYYYPALLQAAFRLVHEGRLDLPAAWSLVSANPAQAAKLTDRGCLAPGQRADIVVVDATDPSLARAVATIVGGQAMYMRGL
jgi:alpha-D-ribose 1-methylphosphonate 5-triphosphate diphosphatase